MLISRRVHHVNLVKNIHINFQRLVSFFKHIHRGLFSVYLQWDILQRRPILGSLNGR